MQGILKRQNEPEMLKIQFVAKFFFNIAEKTNRWATYLALIPLLCLLPHADSFDGIVTTLAVVIDILVGVLIFVTRRCVNYAADLRAYFDDCVLYASKAKLNNKLTDLVYRVVRVFSKRAEIAVSNTGSDTPPGVRDWYGLKTASDYNDAVVKCLNENRWWDEKLNIHRVISTAIFLGVVVALTVIFVFAVGVKWHLVLLAVIQLIMRLSERLVANIKYYNATERLKGAYDVLDRSHTRANQKSVQEAVDARRHISVLGSNWWHTKRAHELSEQYDNTRAQKEITKEAGQGQKPRSAFLFSRAL